MANVKFTEFPSAATVGSTDIIPIVQGGVNKKATVSVFSTYIGSGFVPYVGATTDLNLDTHDLYTAKVWLKDVPNDGFGSLELTDGVLHFEDVDGHSMVTMEDGYLTIANASTIRALLDVSALSANRDFAFPNASGTLALTSQIPSVSGTTNYLPKFTGASALGNSLIFDNGTSVGIGTATPGDKLDVYSSANSQQGLKITNPNAGASAIAVTKYSNGTYTHLFGILGTGYTTYGVLQANEAFMYSAAQNMSFGADGNSSIKFGTGTGVIERMRITSTGNVGIGTTTPSEKLEVQNAAAGAKIKVSNSGGGYATLECSSNATSVAQLSFTNQLSLIGGNVGIGTTTPKSYASLTNNGQLISLGNIGVNTGENFRFNNYYNSGTTTDRAISTGFAAGINLEAGSMIFKSSASSVSADTNVTLVERMRIKPSGVINISNIPTSAAGLSTGDIWSNLGILTIV